MKPFFVTLTCLAALVVLFITISGDHARAASGPPDPPHSKPCTIQFRRDALGAAAANPVPPLSDTINGADTSISGTLKHSSAEWAVLERNGQEVWIPKSVILLIQFR
jgi:hypothetical protein